MDVKGKVTIVNGASSGIGKSVAVELAKLGATVVICARRKDMLNQTLEEIKSHSPQSICQACDCTEESQVKKTVKAVYDKYGRIDIMLNIAGMFTPKFVRDSVWQDYYRDMNVGFLGAVRYNAEVLPIMIKQHRGIILNMSSITEHLRPPGLSAYAATKAAVYDYSDILYKEVKGYGIHIGVIEPVLVESEMTVTGEQPMSMEELSQEIIQGSMENYRDLNAHINMQDPEVSAREIIREGIEKERFQVYTGEPQLWTVYGLVMKILPGLNRGFSAVMSAAMYAAENNPAAPKNPAASKAKSGMNAVDPAKMVNAMFASTRPASSLIKELYVGLDEGLSRTFYNIGKKFIKK